MRTNRFICVVLSLIIGGTLMAFSLFGCASVHTERIIPAAPDKVWSVLTAIDEVKLWNPVLIPLEGSYQEGEKLKYRMVQPDGKESEVCARVVKLIPGQLLNQRGGIPGILTFNHSWILEQVEEGTKVIQHEEYRGIGVWFWDYSWVEPAYSSANDALNARVLSQGQ